MWEPVCPRPSLSSPYRSPLASVWWPGLGQCAAALGPHPRSPTNTPPTLPGSSDDGDELQRCREAAVSAPSDIPPGVRHPPPCPREKRRKEVERKPRMRTAPTWPLSPPARLQSEGRKRSLPSSTGTRLPWDQKKKEEKAKKASEASHSQQRVLLPCPSN